MRIIEGTWRAADLVSPARRVRSTAENVRAAWLDFVADRLEGAMVLDLFAGSGALGLEALSRGAAHADFVENGPEALHSLKANVAALRVRTPPRGWQPRVGGPFAAPHPTARVFKRDAIPFTEGLDAGVYDLAFADPPYGSGKADRVVAAWHATPFATVLGVEHATDHELPPGAKYLDHGETRITFYGLPGKRRSRGRKRKGGARSGSSGRAGSDSSPAPGTGSGVGPSDDGASSSS